MYDLLLRLFCSHSSTLVHNKSNYYKLNLVIYFHFRNVILHVVFYFTFRYKWDAFKVIKKLVTETCRILEETLLRWTLNCVFLYEGSEYKNCFQWVFNFLKINCVNSAKYMWAGNEKFAFCFSCNKHILLLLKA